MLGRQNSVSSETAREALSMSKMRLLSAMTLTLMLPPLSQAQELVYTPVNPSFGGSSFNSSHLLSTAEIHRPDPPESDAGAFGDPRSTQTNFFIRQLESRILSRLSLDIVDKIFGDDAEPSGEFVFSDTTISFETLLDGTILLDIVDNATGGTTTIEIPAFLTASE
jgi:curli production assembly/transport component CsgF